jgi:2-polyprenyl-3-methyl-5-hydroxy-6-metoxy-1,4-benzoquinol methylase
MSKEFKQEVLTAFQKVSPSKIGIESKDELAKYQQSQFNLFFHKLKFPPELFRGKKVIDFGCGTGEMDIVLANWGANVEGFDFNDISVARANELKEHFGLASQTAFSVGDIDTYAYQPGVYDIAASFGVIAHVPDQKNMFLRMAEASRKGGFVILGYIEDSGLIQRLMHRAIVLANSDKSDAEIFRIAKVCFSEHIERSVKYGGRSADSVINDYLVNPHYIGISTQKLLSWAAHFDLEFYSGWPNVELPFVVDSPYFKLIPKDSPIYELYFSLLRLRWLYAQDEDSTVFSDIAQRLPKVNGDIESLFQGLNQILQDRDSSDQTFSSIRTGLKDIERGVSALSEEVSHYIDKNLAALNDELLRVLEMIVLKIRENREFDLSQVSGKLFRGYNGLGTSYAVFHKRCEAT